MFRRRRPYRKIFTWAILLGVLLGLWVMNNRIEYTLYEIAEVKAVQIATQAINNAVRSKLAETGVGYQDFMEVHKDSSGKIVLMQANTAVINKTAAETTLEVQAALDRLREESLGIPLGQVTGIDILSNYGPKVSVDIIPMGTVRVDIDDRFEQAGINQTKHSIYLNYNTEVRIVIPLKSGKADVMTKVPVVENIVIGNVPSTFVTLPGGLYGPGTTEGLY